MEKYIAEFLGTFVLVAINNGVVANVLLQRTKGKDGGWILITLAAGLAVTFGIYTSMLISGAHINPAVSIAMTIIGKLDESLLIPYVIAQLLGGMFGAFMVYLAYKKHYDKTTDDSLVLATFSTSPAIDHKGWNILTEIIATFFLVGLIVVITSDLLSIDSNLIPIIIGTLVMVLGISFGGSTGFAMNPARDLGPRITHSLLQLGNSNWKYAWIPVAGPIIGGILGALVFTFYLGGIA